ncbi:MarR family transcriptional regulator [Brevibacterium sediminis]|uniref:MarR family winged helix-turn-helix transcriptional regulator n=1 Tax=Brevibacterium sediminis TaxID=1857024 RepID=UPI0021750530|nr:MarR family transcriptional regulator [Brevibacterium sediminis]MCS4593191.1 MarR family transcriptional regulator [Brevibacterium sediminis]
MSDPVPQVPEINSGDSPMWRVLDRYRELELQLAIFGQHLSARLGMRPIDLQCFNLVHRHEAVTTGELARMLALPPATTTGIIDRLVQQGWVIRERSETDRRTVVVRVDPTRPPELFSQLAPLGEELSSGLSGLDDATLETIAGFLDHAAEATRRATGSQV